MSLRHSLFVVIVAVFCCDDALVVYMIRYILILTIKLYSMKISIFMTLYQTKQTNKNRIQSSPMFFLIMIELWKDSKLMKNQLIKCNV